MKRAQLELFEDPRAARLRERFRALEAVARALPPWLRFGTSSWYATGWTGLVWPAPRTESELAREGLREYVRHPLLRTVGVDRSYYRPLGEPELRAFTSQLPQGFPCCLKVSRGTASLALEGGSRNHDYLRPEPYAREVLGPLSTHFASHAAVQLLELPRAPEALRPSPSDFYRDLETFLAALPSGPRHAVELRDPPLLTAEYGRLLARFGVAHVYNHWSGMPSLAQQAAALDPASQPFLVLRLLLPQGAAYELRRSSLEPFDQLRAPDPAMRAEALAVLRSCANRGADAFVLVGNKAEGCAPLTIEALASEYLAR